MLKYLIQVIQNSFVTGILVAALFAFVHIRGQLLQKKWILGGLLAGTASALLLSVLKATTVLINREFFNIGILSAALLAEIVYFLFAFGVFKNRQHIICSIITAALMLFCLPDIFLYPTEFVAMGESIVSTEFLFKAIGYLTGLAVVGLSALSIYKVSTSLSFSLLKKVLSIILAIHMVNQLATILQFLLARRIIPMQKWLFSFIKISVNYYNYFLYTILIITLLLPVILWIRSLHPKEGYDNPAQHRKIRATSRLQRRWCCVVFSGYMLTILCLTVVKAYSEKEIVLSPAEPMNIAGDEISIPLENINDGHLHRFAYTASDGTEVRFIVIKKNANAFGVGLDACDICGQTGYYERNDQVICKLCDVVMNKSTIGFKGGCNPVPLTYKLNDGKMVIQIQSLEKEKNRFS